MYNHISTKIKENKMKTEEKTNVMRILDQKKIKYNQYNYLGSGAISGSDIFKTIF